MVACAQSIVATTLKKNHRPHVVLLASGRLLDRTTEEKLRHIACVLDIVRTTSSLKWALHDINVPGMHASRRHEANYLNFFQPTFTTPKQIDSRACT